MYDFMMLGATWFYSAPLDADAIKKSLAGLLARVPVLAGRRSFPFGFVLSNKGARFSSGSGVTGSAHTHLDTPSSVSSLVDYQSSLGTLLGTEPLMTVRVTNFEDGTSSIGISLPHCLADGKTYFAIVTAFAAAHNNGSPELVPSPDFEATHAAWSAAYRQLGWCHSPVKLLVGGLLAVAVVPLLLLVLLIIIALFAIKGGACFHSFAQSTWPRAKVHLSQADVAAIKKGVDAAYGGKVTTNEALCSVLTLALHADFGFNSKSKNGSAVMVANMQGKGVFAGQRGALGGNFTTFVPQRLPAHPSQLTVAQAAQVWRELGDTWRDSEKAAALIATAVRFFSWPVPLSALLYPQQLPEQPALVFNNQSVYPSAQIHFGSGTLLGYTPWHGSNQIHIVAAVEDDAANAVEPPLLRQQQRHVRRLVGSLASATAFELADADRSGDITKAELISALAKVNVELSDREADELFLSLDKDASGGIDQSEFESAFYAARLAGGVDIYVPATSPAAKDKLAHWRSAEFKQTLISLANTGATATAV
jgi:hypothetical protein